MRRERVIAATTGLDAHDEKLGVEALAGMVEQIRRGYIPIWVEHDLRYPPVGRVVDAELVQQPDGQTALVELIETWEPSDTAETVRGDGRRIPLDVPSGDRFGLTIDRSFLTPEGQAVVRELASLGGGITPELRVKKAADAVSWLVIQAGPFVLGGIALGILGKIGADIWDQFKDALGRRADAHPDGVLDFNLGVTGEEGDYEAHVLVTGPGENVRSLFDAEFTGIDEAVGEVVRNEGDVSRIVVLWKDGHMTVAHASRSDGYPFVVNEENIPPLPQGHSDE